MEEKTRNAGQGLGVAALVLGVISFIVALIPCVGLFALFTALIAIVLGAIGLSQAARNNDPKGLMLGGLILGVVALFIAIAQIVFFSGFADKAPYFEEKFEDVIKDIERDVLDEFEDGSFSITIEDGEEKIEINSTIKRELRDALDELEELEEELEEDLESTRVDIKVKIDTLGRRREEVRSNMTGAVRSYQLINYIIAGIIVIIFIYSGIFSPVSNNYPVSCVHEQITGMSCPSCGMSHSFSYIIRGDISEAIVWNKYGPRVFLFFLFQLALRVSNILFLKQKPSQIRTLTMYDIGLSLLSLCLGFWQFIIYNLKLIV